MILIRPVYDPDPLCHLLITISTKNVTVTKLTPRFEYMLMSAPRTITDYELYFNCIKKFIYIFHETMIDFHLVLFILILY